MHLRFPEADIGRWANKYSYPRKESELLALRDDIQSHGFLTKTQLALLAQWKSPRSAPRIKTNSEEFVQEITSFALNAKDERSRIESLTLLDGVLWPTASVVLHIFHKEPYPILDFRAIWSVQADQPQFYSFPFWWQYVNFCRDLAERNDIEMRVLDRALWQYSKANQPKVVV
jgi:hypothetical protein